MYSLSKYTGNLIFVLLLFVIFLFLSGCGGCNEGNDLEGEAITLSTQFDSLAIAFNTLRGNFEKKGDRTNEIKAENLRDQMKDVRNEIDGYIQDDDINQNKIDVWRDSFVEFEENIPTLQKILAATTTPVPVPIPEPVLIPEPKPKPKPKPKKENTLLDSDGDGTPNMFDDCPDKFGIERCKGCNDIDRDNICDQYDKCEDLPGIEPHGCPDTDNDGFFDSVDDCPKDSGIAPDGCPIACSRLSRFSPIKSVVDDCKKEINAGVLQIKPAINLILEEFKLIGNNNGQINYYIKDISNTTLNDITLSNINAGPNASQIMTSDLLLKAGRSYQLMVETVITFCKK